MKKFFRRFYSDQEGVIALEACVSLTIFLLVMLTLYSLLRMFTIQSMISHAAQEACQSIALENYSQSSTAMQILQTVTDDFSSLISGHKSSEFNSSSGFSILEYLNLSKEKSSEQKLSSLASTAKKRFAAYLAGGENEANKLLKNYGVVDGLDGINFSGTENTGTDMIIEMTYKVRLIFYLEMFDFGEFDSTQEVCCRLWSQS